MREKFYLGTDGDPICQFIGDLIIELGEKSAAKGVELGTDVGQLVRRPWIMLDAGFGRRKFLICFARSQFLVQISLGT